MTEQREPDPAEFESMDVVMSGVGGGIWAGWFLFMGYTLPQSILVGLTISTGVIAGVATTNTNRAYLAELASEER